jgi:hypothetical protein
VLLEAVQEMVEPFAQDALAVHKAVVARNVGKTGPLATDHAAVGAAHGAAGGAVDDLASAQAGAASPSMTSEMSTTFVVSLIERAPFGYGQC